VLFEDGGGAAGGGGFFWCGRQRAPLHTFPLDSREN